MRIFPHGSLGLVVGSGVALAGATLGIGCSGEGFDGCQASRTCAARAGSAGLANAAGEGGDGSGGKGGGKPGASGKGGGSGAGGSPSSKGGSGGNAHAGASDHGGSGGTHGHVTEGEGGSEAGAPDEPRGGTGGSGHDVGDEGGAAGAAGAEPEPPGDTTPPKIVTTLPANNAKGVRADASITVTFSERMDNAATEAAYQSTTLPREAVNLFWQSDSTVLVVQPKEPLAYVETSDPAAEAKYYSFTIGGAATDVAGNPLGADGTFVFTTARHITQTLPVMENGGIQGEGDGATWHKADVTCAKGDDVLLAGDFKSNASVYFLVSFDISALPPVVLEWSSVRMNGANMSVPTNENPYSHLGNLRFGTLVIADPTTLDPMGFSTSLGIFASTIGEKTVSRDATYGLVGFYGDRAEQGDVSRFLFRFEQHTDNNGASAYVSVACRDITLALDYLAE